MYARVDVWWVGRGRGTIEIQSMNPLNGSFFKFVFGFVGILALGFAFFFVANYFDSKDSVSINAAAVELTR